MIHIKQITKGNVIVNGKSIKITDNKPDDVRHLTTAEKKELKGYLNSLEVGRTLEDHINDKPLEF